MKWRVREWNEIYCILDPIIRSLYEYVYVALYKLTGSYTSEE